MKKIFILLSISLLLGCSKEIITTHEFLYHLGDENNKIASELLLDVYNNNLSALTYEAYMKYGKEKEVFSSKGLFEKISKAKYHFFKAKNDAFLLILYYPEEYKLVWDNSETTKTDSTYHIFDGLEPNLREVAEKINF